MDMISTIPLSPVMGLVTIERKYAHVMAHVTNGRTDLEENLMSGTVDHNQETEAQPDR